MLFRSEGVRGLAERMRIVQAEEIRLMRYWLQSERSVAPTDEVVGRMPGMLTEERVQQLRASSGVDFDRRFIESMVEHHHGAIEMSRAFMNLLDSASASRSIGWFVMHIEAEQAVEVERMLRMLAAMS